MKKSGWSLRDLLGRFCNRGLEGLHPNGLFTSLAFLLLTRLKPEPTLAKRAAYLLGVSQVWCNLGWVAFRIFHLVIKRRYL